jgi:tight adherence protein B
MVVALLTFAATFVVCVLLLLVVGMTSRVETKQAIERLETLTTVSPVAAPEPAVNLRREEILSNIAVLNRLLQNLQLAPKLRLILYQSGLDWRAGDLLLGCVALMILVTWLAYERTGAFILSFGLGVLAGLVPIGYVFRKRGQRFDSFEERLPEALDLMVGALRAGHSLSSALSLVAREMTDPIGREFRQCVDEQNFGLELRAALMNIVNRMPIPDVRTLVTAILIQRETGGNLAEILEKVSHVIRDRFRLRRQIRVHTAQGRLTGWILSVLPLILGVGLYLVNPTHLSILWHRPVGIKMLWGGGIMTLIGAAIIKKIVSIRV